MWYVVEFSNCFESSDPNRKSRTFLTLFYATVHVLQTKPFNSVFLRFFSSTYAYMLLQNVNKKARREMVIDVSRSKRDFFNVRRNHVHILFTTFHTWTRTRYFLLYYLSKTIKSNCQWWCDPIIENLRLWIIRISNIRVKH